jgi:thermostable 8-oxoguanine DNA glycosylase
MSRLSELQEKLAKQKALVSELAAQAAQTTGEASRQLMRKQAEATRAAQAAQNDLDATLNRVAYLREAGRLAHENLAVIDRHIAATRLMDSAKADAMGNGRAATQREIDGIMREITRLGASVDVLSD